MPIILDRNKGLPLYIQLKNEIVKAIRAGEFKVGDRMMTERELAQTLNVSRKTVSHAYNLLEKDKIILSHQGKGTYIADSLTGWQAYNDKEDVIKFIDLSIESALEHEMSLAEFIDIAKMRFMEKNSLLSKAQAIFVECNIEQARVFSEQLTEKTNFTLNPLTVSALEIMSDETLEMVQNSKVIIPTFNHVTEVKEILSTYQLDIPVMGVAIKPDLKKIIKIAKYPENTTFGVVSISKEFFFKVYHELENAGLNDLNMAYSISDDISVLNEFVQDKDVIIVSPGKQTIMNQLEMCNCEVIRFDYNLDHGSLKSIMARLLEQL